MTDYAEIGQRLAADHLDILGAFHPTTEDGLPETVATLLLLGPREPGFWAAFRKTPEARDDAPDAMDRWSRRVIGTHACNLGGKAYFPFAGPPWHPFIGWAKRSGHAWASEVTILVHDRAGLLVSYRGAIGLRERLDLPPPGRRPCDTCAEKPCLTACPVGALTPRGYDVPACKGYLDTDPGRTTCMAAGCLVRRACPVSAGYARDPDQSAYHMRHFHR